MGAEKETPAVGRASRARRRGRAAAAALVGALALSSAPACVVVDTPMLALRSVAGGIHNVRQVSGVTPFFFLDGRLGVAANGALFVEDAPGGELRKVADVHAEIDDPCASSDGRRVVFVSGRDQVQAGGGHKDHVFQVYELELATGEWRRVTASRRAEVLPRYTAAGLVFVRRPDYDGWSLDDPWGEGALFVRDAATGEERRLTEAAFQPFLGVDAAADDTLVLFSAVAAGEEAVYRIDAAREDATPTLVLEGARLPARVPRPDGSGTRTWIVARPGARDAGASGGVTDDAHDAWGLAEIDGEGRVVREYDLGLHAILKLAVAPDGARVVFSDFDAGAGQFGEYRLWQLPLSAGVEADAARVVQLDAVPWRPPSRGKPLDVIMPPSWLFRSGMPPGSR